jgi:hypothetical protein
MRRLLLVVAVLLALAGAAQATARDSAARKPVLVATATGLTYHVFRADPISLRPIVGGRSWASAGFTAASRSPDGKWLVTVRADGGRRFVRLATMRAYGLGVPSTSWAGLQPVAWLSNRLLVAAAGGSGSIVGIDVATRTIVWQRSFDGDGIVAEARIRDRLVVLVGSFIKSTPARVWVVRAKGPDRSVLLDRLLVAGQTATEETHVPGLAVDPVTNTAYVVDDEGLVAEINLDAMTVAYHGAPRAFAKIPGDHYRQAISLGNGMLAVTGWDLSTSEVNGVKQVTLAPTGLYLVNAETGAARLLQRDTAAVKLVGRSLLAFVPFGTLFRKEAGAGLTLYGLDGTLRAHFFGSLLVGDVKALNGLAYVSLADRTGHIGVLDLAAARVLRTVSRPTLQVLAG